MDTDIWRNLEIDEPEDMTGISNGLQEINVLNDYYSLVIIIIFLSTGSATDPFAELLYDPW